MKGGSALGLKVSTGGVAAMTGATGNMASFMPKAEELLASCGMVEVDARGDRAWTWFGATA